MLHVNSLELIYFKKYIYEIGSRGNQLILYNGIFSKNDTYNRKYVMKSIKTNPNFAKGPDTGKIENKLYCILLTTLYLS
jgi:hypothetical protein